jgi:prepilin peptidase CpaA
VNERQVLANLLTASLLAIAVIWDVRSRRIPNQLTIGVAALGIVLQVLLQGWLGAQQAALGWLVGFALLLLPCLLGWVGGGDVKLLAAVGALQGPTLAFWSGLYGIAVGGLFSSVILLRRRSKPAAGRRQPFAYGPALALGTLAALLLR